LIVSNGSDERFASAIDGLPVSQVANCDLIEIRDLGEGIQRANLANAVFRLASSHDRK